MLESGQELSARFVLVRRLGAGGSGEVWLTRDNELKQFVALKILADRLMQDVAAIAALQRECENVRMLYHPNILEVHGLQRSARHAWLAMEYVSGGDLTSLRGRATADILRVLVPVANALAHAHRAGLVHRDVKPANILLTSDGAPRLADFGIALAVAEVPIRAGHGSRFNMSPQQLEGKPASPADDIYAFGALLYELLSGYPPFYPEASAARVRSEIVPPLESPQVPPSLSALISRCLAKSPSERPANMEAVERDLTAALAELPAPAIVNASAPAAAHIQPPAVRPPNPSHGEALRGEWHHSAAGGSNEDELRRQGFRRGLGAASIAAGVVGIIIVFFLLPKWVEQKPTATYRQAASSVAPAAEPEEEQKEIDFAELARLKQEAEDQRADIDARAEKLRAQAVEEWGGAEYRQVTETYTVADKAFTDRAYDMAAKQFADIVPLLTTLEQRVGEVLKEQLAAGAKALGEGRSADAKAAFEFANRIEPDNRVAAQGLKRAGTLDEVLALVTEAERLEKEGNVAASADVFRKALALDKEAPRAEQGLARVNARVAADAFASTMAKGFSALSMARYPEARSAFEAAGRMRANAPEVAQALKQVEQDERTRIITAKLADAKEFERQERWADALQVHKAVLQLDSTVASANEGVARVAPRADLNQQLEVYLTQPERLFSVPVRTAARDTLKRASAIANPGPVLQQQVVKLSDWVSKSDLPVAVALQSDNITQVTIYRIGTLGTFAQRSLELAPGSYVVVGTRPGYRDVRREINVMPGAMPPPVVIRCEDKI
jgi:tetratricopeptide (TPR) repeat protein